jgi:NAD(P)-dependent dehydrogenase (short-subunit alcohol dehydrogenase family)
MVELPSHWRGMCALKLTQALVALAVAEFGRLDIAFNNAGTLG